MTKASLPSPKPAYSILETLAISSRSVVQRARRNADDQTVVLKSLNQAEALPQQRKDLEFELQTLRDLSSPLILRAHEVCEVEGRLALVLEHFGGQALVIPPAGLELSACLRIATQAVRALSYVHERGIVHNDVKPGNLLVNRDTLELKLIDFHLASGALRPPDAGAPVLEGSFAYLAPERTGRMNRKPDYRADYYSLGVTLFELASGQLPLTASDALGWAHAHISKRPPLLSDVKAAIPQAFAELVAKLLAKDPDDRYQSSHGLLWDLELCAQAWASQQAIPSFTLGERDVSQALEVDSEIVGRDAELTVCRQVFAQAMALGPRLLLVSGAVGVGKSALVSEFGRTALSTPTFFLSSSFDAQERNQPYSALIHAFESLVGQLLVESEAKLAGWRERLLSALGPNISVMIDLVPQIARITGPQPAVAELSPSETQHRLQHVIREFIKVFASAAHPLVIAFDDCQWMDSSTPDALFGLLTSADVRHFLALFAFRNTEIDARHVLEKLSERLKLASTDLVHKLELKPLDSDALTTLLARTLHTTPAEVADFAALVREKTDGNPFFVGEVLSALHRQKILTLDVSEGRWRWDLARARATAVSDNVGALMAERIARLTPRAQSVLSAAACFGNHFEIEPLAAVLDIPGAELSSLAWEAAAERLVQPLDRGSTLLGGAAGEAYAFQHARVQQAAYARLVDRERERLHRRIGQLLQAEALRDPARERIFDMLHHLNLGRAGSEGTDERVALAELNLRAAQRAEKTAAFGIAEAHAEIAIELVGEAERSAEPGLEFRALFAHAKAIYLGGDLPRAEGCCRPLFELAPNALARAGVHVLRTRILEHMARLPEAVAEIRAGLALLGVVLPEAHAEIEQGIGAGIGKMQGHLAQVPVEELANLPAAQSAETAMVLDLLMQVVPPAIQTYPPLFILAELMMFDIALTSGVTQVSCKNFVDCGIIQAAILGNHDVAYRLGRTAFKLLERYAPTPLESAVSFVFGGFVSHWRAHFREGNQAYEVAQRRGVELGDYQHLAYAWAHRTQRSILTGRPLEDCQRELAEAVGLLTRIHASGQIVGTLVAARALGRLRPAEGQDEAAIAQGDAEATATVLGSKNAQWAYSYGQCQTMVSFLLGDLPAARHWQAFTKPYSLAAASLFSVPDYHLFEALLRVEDLKAAEAAERPALLEAIDQALAKLEGWGRACPENFAHKYELLAAERARIQGEPLERVLAGYQRSIAAAGEDFPQMRGLVNEREANLWLELGDERHARVAYEAAYRLYAAWGATAKLRRMELEHPSWVRVGAAREGSVTASSSTQTTTAIAGALDAGSILKATQSISKEVETQKLFSALMATLIENAGAQQGCLVLQSQIDENFYVEARASVDATSAPVAHAEALDAAGGVCTSAVRYVLRTREALSLDDACANGNFQTDPYIKEQRVRSLLCVPILRQGEILGVLYLENNQTSHAFTRERIGILQVIASQAAISIYNAQLYASLERRVRERTQELAQKNRQIASMLDNMDQGVFTIDEELRVLPGYSRHLEQILGTSEIVGQNCMNLLFSCANLRPDTLQAADGALRFSFGVESWLAVTNASHLISEFSRPGPDGELRYFEVDWNLICDDLDRVERLLVVVRDVTLVRRLKQAANEKAREADIVAQVLESGLDAFKEFCGAAHGMLAQNRAALAPELPLTAATLVTAFRNLHTLKGNARLLCYTHLVDALHSAEEAYAELRRANVAEVDRELLRTELTRVGALVAQYEDICARKLAPLAQTRDGRIERSLREIAELVAREDHGGPTGVLHRIRASLDRLDGVPFVDLVKETSRIVPSLAVELDRSVPLVHASDQGQLLAGDWVQPIRDILVQCFRNALYHGIEPREARAAVGKTPEGHIQVALSEADGSIEIQISDDGRGLALGSLRQTFGRDDVDDRRLADHIFESGVSTAREVGLVAGRGVGLDIVRSLLRSRGGDVAVRFTGDEREGYRPFAFVLVLPESALLNDAAAHPSYPPRAAE